MSEQTNNATKQSPTQTARELVARRKTQAPNPSPVAAAPARVEATAVAKVTHDTVDDYLNEVAPSDIVGRMIKFSKDGKFVTHDDDKEVPEAAEFTCLAEETLVGFVKFNGEGEPPDRIMGLLYGGFRMPPVESLPDRDESQWADGLNGGPEDPWKHHMYVVLQNTETLELYTFVTSSKTGRGAVGNLLKHYNRTRKTNPDELPVIRLRTGGFTSRKKGVGFVTVPVFVVVGRRARDSVAKPDTSTAAFLDDELPL